MSKKNFSFAFPKRACYWCSYYEELNDGMDICIFDDEGEECDKNSSCGVCENFDLIDTELP